MFNVHGTKVASSKFLNKADAKRIREAFQLKIHSPLQNILKNYQAVCHMCNLLIEKIFIFHHLAQSDCLYIAAAPRNGLKDCTAAPGITIGLCIIVQDCA